MRTCYFIVICHILLASTAGVILCLLSCKKHRIIVRFGLFYVAKTQ